MSNIDIAKQLADISDMMEILGENQFKIIAYQRASRLIEMQTEELDDIYTHRGEDGLREIPGIGESIAEKIVEFLKTGKIRYHDELLKKVPKAVIVFNTIPGVGPKTAKKLYDVFRVSTLRDLKKSLAGEKHMDEFKPKTRANILRGIDILSRYNGRMLISFAEPIAQSVIKTLKQYPEIEQCDAVGSLRRMQETIGDIDVIASIRSSYELQVTSDKIINRFCDEPFVSKIISKGDTKATIINKKNVQIDLEILPSDEYGSLLQHFTGSKDHNIALRTYAEQHGFSISEHGVKKSSHPEPFGNTQGKLREGSQDVILNEVKNLNQNKIPASPAGGLRDAQDDNKLIKCPTEKEVYSTLKMQTPPPELRENRGEIEAALAHRLPTLVTLKDIKGDLQMHSTFSDGQVSIEEMARACKRRGYSYLAITDHPATLGITQGLKEKDVDKYVSACRKAWVKVGIRVFAGIEANIKPNGDIDLHESMLRKFDIVLGSVHSSFSQEKEIATKRLVKAIANSLVHIIAHPSGRILNRRPAIDVDWEEVFAAAKKYDKILEINAYPDRLDLNDILAKRAIELGIKLVISTDSHSPEHLDNMRYGVSQARRGWASASDIINTFSLEKIMRILHIK